MAKFIGEFAVHVRAPNGEVASFLPGDSVPDWAVPMIGAHAFAHDAANNSTPSSVEDHSATADGPPPQAGAGASRVHWADYATAHGVTVDDDDKRDEIIAACRKAGVAVE